MAAHDKLALLTLQQFLIAKACELTATAPNAGRGGIISADAAANCSFGVDGGRGDRAFRLRHRRQPLAGARVHARHGQRGAAAGTAAGGRRLIHEQLDSVFTAASYPRQVRVSPPHHEPYGSGWSACVRAELTSVMGKPLGTETYRVTISSGAIIDRRRAEADDNCGSETYQPI